MKTITVQVTPELVEHIRESITAAVHCVGLDFRTSPKAKLRATIHSALVSGATCQLTGGLGAKPAGRPFVVIQNGQLIAGGRRA